MTILERGTRPLESGGTRSAAERAEGEPRPFRFGKRELLTNVGFWTFFGAMTAAIFLSNDFEPAGVRRVVPETVYWFFQAYLWAGFTPIIFWLVWSLRAQRPHLLLRGLFLIGVGLGLAVLASVIRDIMWEQVLAFPARSGIDNPARSWAEWMLLEEEPIVCAAIFTASFLREHRLERQARERGAMRVQARVAQVETRAAQLQAQLAQARLAVLRSQLNPHFLFNTLNALSALVDDDPRDAQRMIARLSELLRFALEAREEEEVPLHQELTLAQRYLEILEIRFPGRLQTRVSAAPDLQDALVPNLILQPLLENAMKHGVSRTERRSSIEVGVRREVHSLILTVTDSGEGQRPEASVKPGIESGGTGLGLRNTRARLKELYGSQQRLRLVPTSEGGMIAEIVLPFHTLVTGRAAARLDPSGEGAHA